MSLTRYCFVHRDYMDIYIKELPLTILDRVAANFNCEDVAMSFLISSLTNGRPSLLADTWAIKVRMPTAALTLMCRNFVHQFSPTDERAW